MSITVTQADSGFTVENIAMAEWLWANLPVGPVKFHDYPTHEKALICHTVARFEREMCARHRTQAAGEPTCWLYENNEGHRCVQHVQGLMDLDHWTETPLYAHPPATDVAALVEAAKAVQAWEDATDDGELPTAIAISLRQALTPFTKGQNDE